MIFRTLVAIGATFIVAAATAQSDSLARVYAATISAAELNVHLSVLASDAYQGRDTGKEGQKMAAAYLKQHFQRMGIPPVPTPYAEQITEGYFQPYELVEEHVGGLSLASGADVLELGKGLVYFNLALTAGMEVGELVYMGNGAALPAGLDLSGRVVLVNGADLGSGQAAMGALRQRVEQVRKGKPRLILVSTPNLSEYAAFMHGGTRMRLADEEIKPNGAPTGQLVLVDESAMNGLLGKSSMRKLRRKKPGHVVPVAMDVRVAPKEERVVAENVLAYIEGSDKKEEVIVITAHYDHIGVENGVVYNGADDDGSGTVALLEIAEAFAKAKAAGHGPRRSVLIMPVSGEEKGLLGSRFYSDHPVFPLASTVANLNIDMIGRVDSAHATSKPYVYIIGSDRLSTDLHALNETANTDVGLVLDYAFNAEDDPNRFYYRSDHYNFARKGVPCIFYFSGVHEDYHQPGDDIEKIRFDLLHQRTLLVFRTAWELANRATRIVVDKPVK
jgi:Peptidase family M28